MNHYDGSGGDDQSEDGQLRSNDENSNEDDEIDTADSLEIKPPQAHRTETRHRFKKSSKEKKHSRDRRHRDRFIDHDQSQHHQHLQRSGGGGGGQGHDRNVRRHKHRQDRGGGGNRKYSGNDGRVQGNDFSRGPNTNINNIKPDRDSRYDQYRERENYRMTGHMQEQRDIREPRDRDKERVRERQRRDKDSPDKSDGDKILEDLRSRLLIKKRKYETESKPDEKIVSGGEYESSKRSEKKNIKHDENHEVKRERDHVEEKKHHHKEKRDREKKHSVTVAEMFESDFDAPPAKIHKERHSSKPMTVEEKEHVSRREKLLEAEREMARRKELAREELEARREMRRERLESKRESSSASPVEQKKKKSKRSSEKKNSKEDYKEEKAQLSVTDDDEENDTESDSSSSSQTDDDEDDNGETKDDSDVEMMSPLSVGELTKSDMKLSRTSKSRSQSRDTKSQSRSTSRSKSRTPHSRSRSRSLSRSRSHSQSRSPRSRTRSPQSRSRSHTRSPRHRSKSGTPENLTETKESFKAKESIEEKKVEEIVKIEDELPPYYPGIQGCRSVEEFQCLNRIEEGTYGVVYRAKDKRTETIVALKKLKMEKEKEGFPITSLREINTLLKGQHPNIVTVREIVVGSNMDKIFIVMDYVEHDLKSLMETMKHKKQVFLPGEVKCLTQQLLKAVAHLHDNWILHRDLKTSNLLLSHKGILKVGDFGLAREYGSPLKSYTSVVVTLWYRAPELLLCSKEYSTAIDIWSVGCIFAEFLAMTALFPGKSEVDQLNRIFKDLGTPNERIWPGYSELPAVLRMTFTDYPVSNLRKKFSHLTSELGMSLLQSLLTYDPKQRFTADQALKAHYFKELPLPIDPAMFPTWPAKSELGSWKQTASPKPPSGGSEFKQLGADDGDHRWGAAMMESRQLAMGPGFSLKF